MPMPTPDARPRLCLVTPAFADANNGNWQTAQRWARLLAPAWRVRLAREWPDGEPADALLALHARRSAASVAAWAEAHPDRPLVLALTGTDLYRDIVTDAAAQRSLALAHRLIVLQERAPLAVPERWRDKCRVVFPSGTAWRTLPKTDRHLRVVVLGHLRAEKAPEVVFEAARALAPGEGIRIDHIGAALEPAWAEAARATAAACPHYRWLGGLPHVAARRRLQRAHLLLHPSAMEGGAHAVMEAVLSGTPVLASQVDGNVGMLGEAYAGYFPPGDVPALVARLRQLRQEMAAPRGALTALQAQCGERAALFRPDTEQARLIDCLAGWP